MNSTTNSKIKLQKKKTKKKVYLCNKIRNEIIFNIYSTFRFYIDALVINEIYMYV